MHNNPIHLNKQQLEAVEHFEGPLLILSGAGTGKTTTLIEKIIYLINSKKVKPEEILTITFTVNSANNLKSKLYERIGDDGKRVYADTFHAFSHKIINDNYKLFGYKKKPHLISDSEAYFLIKENFDTLNITSELYRRSPIDAIKSMKLLFDKFRHNLIQIDFLNKSIKDKNLEQDYVSNPDYIYQLQDAINIFPLFQKWKKQTHKIDYGDMILLIWELLESNQKFREEIQKQYKYILVDEFQDNNYALSQIIKIIGYPDMNITVVGDDDQSIYSFRGASLGNIEDFKDSFMNYSNYKEVTLYQNYRSTQQILDFSNQIISSNNNRIKTKKLESNSKNNGENIDLYISESNVQDIFIPKLIEKIMNKENILYKNIGILTRNHSQAKRISDVLNNHKIPNNYFSQKLFRVSIISEILSWMNIVADNIQYSDICLAYLFNKYNINYNYKKNTSLFEYIYTNKSKYSMDAQNIINNAYSIKSKLKSQFVIDSFWDIVKISKVLIYKNKYHMSVKYRAHIESFKELHSIVEKFTKRDRMKGRKSFKRLVDYLNLIYEVNDKELIVNQSKFDAIQLMTVHSAKGMEFSHVIIPYLHSGAFPSNFKTSKFINEIPIKWKAWDINKHEKELHLEEERRIFYVALTRAMEKLYLLAPDRRQSKFIKEIDKTKLNKEDLNMEDKKTKNSNIETLFINNLYKQIESGCFDEAKDIIDAIRCIGEIRAGRKIEEITYIKKSNYLEEIKEFISRNNQKEISNHHKINLSASKIEAYESCPLKYKYRYDLNIPGKKVNPNLILGNLIHKVLQAFHEDLESYKDQKILVELLEQKWDADSFVIKNQETQFKKDAYTMMDNYFQQYCSKYLDTTILSVEEAFNVEFDENIVLTGRCDRIDQNTDQSIHVIDYKTSQNFKNPKQILKDMQLGIYTIFLRKEYPKSNISASLMYLRNADDIIVTNQFSDNDLELIKERIIAVSKGIQSNNFDGVKSFNCNYCDYKDFICPVWIEN